MEIKHQDNPIQTHRLYKSTPTNPTNTPIKITVAPTSFTHTSSQILCSPQFRTCSIQSLYPCHQSNESIDCHLQYLCISGKSVYADQNVGCVSCHYDEMAVLDGSSSYSTLSSQGFQRTLGGIVYGLFINVSHYPTWRKNTHKIFLINTGSGHSMA